METVILEYNAGNRQAEKLIEYIRSLRFVKIKKTEAKTEDEEFNLYETLDRAFADVRLMLDGKKKKKDAWEFLEEMRREEAEAAQKSRKKIYA
jgi:hypothetical protein